MSDSQQSALFNQAGDSPWNPRFALSASVLDNAPIGMVLTSADDKVIWANAAVREIIGASPATIVNRALLPLLHPEDQSGVSDDVSSLLAGKSDSTLREARLIGSDGLTRSVAISTSIALNEFGEALLYGRPPQQCVIQQIIDLTTQRRAEIRLDEALAQLKTRNKELERSNEELAQFAYVASHDLSEPLRVISGHVELLANRYAGQLDEEADRYIAVAVDGCARMRTLIEDLLRYSRAGRELTYIAVDCGEIMEAVRRDLRRVLEDTGGEILVRGDLPIVQMDRSHLLQLFTNLVGNGLKYGRPGIAPVIEVSARRLEDAWQFWVEDNGIGIPPNQRERIFRIFQRLHGRDIPGTGIGLALCRKIVEQRGGQIEVYDNAGGGSSFVFSFPDHVV
jgi:PAS domain S-box-containing protein